jgi:flagellar basal-body rod protein FlgB
MIVNDMSKSQEVYNLLKKSLDASSLRSKVIANNIANINTKNYKRYYVSFEDSLNQNLNELELKTDNDRHIQTVEEPDQIQLKQDTNTSMNEDGNNVDIENEMVNQASNTLMYDALITEANNRLNMTKYIINDGRS